MCTERGDVSTRGMQFQLVIPVSEIERAERSRAVEIRNQVV